MATSRNFKKKKAVSTLEYAVIILAVVVALLAMHLYTRKSLQGRLKQSSDKIGRQFDTDTYTSAYQEEVESETVTQELRNVSDGSLDSNILLAGRVVRDEYEDWGLPPTGIGLGGSPGTAPGGPPAPPPGGVPGGPGGGVGGPGDDGSGGMPGGGSGDGFGGGGGGGGGGGVPVTYDSDISAALGILQNSSTGAYYYDLIVNNNIAVVYEVFGSGLTGVMAYWMGIMDNTIHLNADMRTTSPEAAIAAVICHEATHADYSYNPDKWINYTLNNHPGLNLSDLHITVPPYNSIDQEYNCFKNQVETWKEAKGSYSDFNNDGWEQVYDQGEAYMKSQIRAVYAQDSLPEY